MVPMAKEPIPSITQRGAGKAAHDMRELGKRASDIRPATSAIRTEFRQAEMRLFGREGGAKWPPLKESTQEVKARRGQDPRILRATGALYRSLTSARARDQVDERAPDRLHFGTKIRYAFYHDVGKGVPKRKPIILTPTDKKKIVREIEKYLARKDAGLGADG